MRGRIVSPGRAACVRKLCVEIECRLEMQRLQTSLVGGPELDDGIVKGVAGRAAQPAMGGAVHQRVDAAEQIDVMTRASTSGEFVHALDYQRRAHTARRAKTATLLGEKPRIVA